MNRSILTGTIPPGIPYWIYHFSFLGGLFLTPEYKERHNFLPPCPGLAIKHKFVVFVQNGDNNSINFCMIPKTNVLLRSLINAF